MENIKNYQIAEDLRQSSEYSQYIESLGWKSMRIQEGRIGFQIFMRRLGPVGIAKIQRVNLPLPWQKIDAFLKENKIMMCKIEPLDDGSQSLKFCDLLKKLGYKSSTWPLLGTKTLRVNLRPAENEIFNSFKKDCRYILRKCLVNNSRLAKNEFSLFYDIWKKSAKRKHLWIPSKTEYFALVEAYKNKVFCLTVDDQAGALVLIHKKTAFYYYAGATKEGTEANYPYLVVWEAMKEAKKQGCLVWDFEGIYDKRWPNKGWLGFSHFKKSFEGQEWEFLGSFEKWRWPF